MTHSTTPATPGVPATTNGSPPQVWPPPSGNVVPFPLPWGQTGCCPPGGMNSLMQCYNDIQAATAFICSVMVTCIQTNPAVVQAIIAAIESSGSSVPLIGVTNGADAQPGQVGETITQLIDQPFGAGTTSGQMTFNALPAGDWDIWSFCTVTTDMDYVQWGLSPLSQPGFEGNLQTALGVPAGAAILNLPSNTTRALTSAPSLINFAWTTATAAAAGTIGIEFFARRRR